MTPYPMAAIILAGGRSRRMHREKALLPVHGRTLIEELVEQIRPCFTNLLISVGETNTLSFLNLPLVLDESPGRGPLAAILSALRASPCRFNFIMACDIPAVDLAFLHRLLALAPASEIVVPRHGDGKFEPLFATYDRRIVPVIERQLAAGDMRISSLFASCRTTFVSMTGQDWFLNLNTRQEYHAFLKKRAKPGA